ncbi:5'-nucleotidase C-terminal domain-containing protein [Marinisporobacter balticus]|uniref:2',3'-cyclic-nucleotide 2'-phosphodiesterase/3'-nucleotidase n=1 Tax=Marinisporobacter balticus TaxID=2018667 RepID=A0A4R2K6Y8_9FIRM|nr:5'-nucleotidase C-terminal domain-containing protein [Marinisporobacter balticus]TCO69073.1 2',3'-cyclic-nucleotide 2'-phosphodiesterase/3'-nucleotidase [Marinisporobacter balticus]
MNKSILRKLTGLILTFVFIVTMTPIYGVSNAIGKENVNITILGTSDVHGRFMPWDYASDIKNMSGSLTQIYSAVEELKKQNQNTILVDCGDAIQDNFVETFNSYDENPMVVGMNEMGYDTWTMGNHEFNFGTEILNKTISKFKGTALAGNIYKEEGSRYLPAYKIIEKDGIKVAIIGMTTPMIVEFEEGSDHLKGLVVKQPIDETKKIIDELKGKVDVLVGVMHMGEDNENNIAGTGVIDMANACPELDVIIAGHMHKNVSSNTINGVLITEPYKYGGNISKVDLSFEKSNDEVKLVNKKAETISVKNYPSNKDLEKKFEYFHNILIKNANEVIGQLQGINMVEKDEIKGIPTVQVEATPLVKFFHEVALYYSKADVVAISIDNDRAKLDMGDIKKKDIAYNYQYAGGEVSIYEVTGKDLKDYMEWSADYFNTLKEGDVTISFNPKRRASKYSTNDLFGGVTYKIDLTKEKGDRIVDLKLANGTNIEDDTRLKLGMNAYRMASLIREGGPLEGRNFSILWDSKTAFGEDEGTIRNLSIKYIKEVKEGVIEPKLNQNWEIIGFDKNAKEREIVKRFVNEGMIEVPKTEDKKYTNVASINVRDKMNLSDEAYIAKIKEQKEIYINAKTEDEKKAAHIEAELIRALNNDDYTTSIDGALDKRYK